MVIFENDIEQRTYALIQEQNQKREARLARKALLNKRGGFAAARLQNVLNQNLALLTPNQESVQNRNVRARARNLYNNNPIARRYVSLLQDNVIGQAGFRLQSMVTNVKGLTNTKVARKIEMGWEDFAKVGNCEVTGLYSLRDVLMQILTGMVVDGEILVRTVLGRGKYGFQLQLIDADRLYAPGSTYQNLPNGNRLVQGVEVDEFNAPVCYHILSGYMAEGGQRVVEVPANEVIHLFLPHRTGFSRGISSFAPVIEPIEMLEGYRKAELVAARMAACKSLVYETEADGDEVFQGDFDPTPLEAGMAEWLPPGVTAKVLDPSHPNSAFPTFDATIRKEIAAGLGVSANTLNGDYESTSYSSMRAAFSNERSQFRMFQAFLIERFLDRVFSTFIDVATISGKLDLVPVKGSYESYKSHEFKPKGFDYFDPSKEMNAWVAGYQNNLYTLTEILALRGVSIDEFLQKKKQEEELFIQYGVNVAPMAHQASLEQQPADGSEEVDNEEKPETTDTQETDKTTGQ